MQWIKDFKLAILNEQDEKIATLLEKCPDSFTCKEDMEEAAALIQEAKKLLDSKKEKLGQEMAKLKKARKFINSH